MGEDVSRNGRGLVEEQEDKSYFFLLLMQHFYFLNVVSRNGREKTSDEGLSSLRRTQEKLFLLRLHNFHFLNVVVLCSTLYCAEEEENDNSS